MRCEVHDDPDVVLRARRIGNHCVVSICVAVSGIELSIRSEPDQSSKIRESRTRGGRKRHHTIESGVRWCGIPLSGEAGRLRIERYIEPGIPRGCRFTAYREITGLHGT